MFMQRECEPVVWYYAFGFVLTQVCPRLPLCAASDHFHMHSFLGAIIE
jgi:hypothetical protein